MRSSFIVGVAIAVLAGCGRSPQAADPNEAKGLVIVKADPGAQQQAVDSLKSNFNGQRMKVLSQSGAEVWQVPAARSADVQKSIRDKGVGYMEFLSTPANPVLTEQTVLVEQLTPAQRSVVSLFTRALTPADFRIAEARPLGLSADVLSQGFTDSNRLSLQLLANQRIDLTPTGIERRGAQDFTWRGLAADGVGDAVLVVRPEGVTGSVRTPDATYSLMPLPEGRQLIIRVDPQRLPAEHPPQRRGGALHDGGGGGGRGDSGPPPPDCPNDQGGQVDVLVVYSGDAAAAMGASAAGVIQLAIDETNEGFRRSQITTRIHLAGSQQIAFAETHDFERDVAALTSPSDGIADGVHALRSSVNADAVVMIVAAQDYCGMADTIDARATSAFAIVSVVCATGYYSFGHELGHLFGARHDEAADPSGTPFPYAHGYIDGAWRTIMAYDGCNGCRRVLNWSNPAVLYPETGANRRPTGVTGRSENAKAVSQRTPWLVRFRCAPPQG